MVLASLTFADFVVHKFTKMFLAKLDFLGEDQITVGVSTDFHIAFGPQLRAKFEKRARVKFDTVIKRKSIRKLCDAVNGIHRRLKIWWHYSCINHASNIMYICINAFMHALTVILPSSVKICKSKIM